MKPKKIRLLIIGISVFVIIILGASGFWVWRSYVIKVQETRTFKMAQDLLAASRPAEALAIIKARNYSEDDTGYQRWLALEIAAYEKQRNIPRLLYLFEKDQTAFTHHEEASLLICRSLLQIKSPNIYQSLRESWRSRETIPEAWFALDVDAFIQAGNLAEAQALLESRSFEGPLDCGRLIRLALLKAGDDMNAAWQLLDDAYTANPRNHDVRLFRAQVLEQMGKLGPARVEYVAAHLADPQNLTLRDQLAEFYRRHEKYDLALKTWAEGLNPPSWAYIWLKTLFWSRVTGPVAYNWGAEKQPLGLLKPYVEYLLELPKDMFWDAYAFLNIPGSRTILPQRQEFFWLQLLQALKEGNETRALDLLKTNSFKNQSWHPQLEWNLRSLLTYRRWDVFSPPDPDIKKVPDYKTHQFFTHLISLSKNGSHGSVQDIPTDLDQLFHSEEAFSAVFLAGGWLETALQLQRSRIIPENFPKWYVNGITQAIRYKRGIKDALDFAKRQKSNPLMELLTAELMLADGRVQEGMSKLGSLNRLTSDIGLRAAWLSCMVRLDQGQIKEAEHIINGSSQLKRNVVGKEILARIALTEGRITDADKIYGVLADQSVEAKTYLARRAFERQDWILTRQLIQDLLAVFPDSMQLRANLDVIDQKEKNNEEI